MCVSSCHPTFSNFPWISQKQLLRRALCEAAPYRSKYTSLLRYTEVRSRGNTLKDALFCVAKEAASVFPNKNFKIQKILEDTNFILQLSYFSDILGVMNHSNCYLQGPGSNIVDFAIELTTSRVGKVRLASHVRLFDPRDVALCEEHRRLFLQLPYTPHFQFLCGRMIEEFFVAL